MRILWISHFLPYPPKAGLLQRGYHLIRELARHSDVDLLTFNQPRLLNPLMPPTVDAPAAAAHALEDFCRVRGVVDIPLARIPQGRAILALMSLMRGQPYEMSWLRSPKFEKLLGSLLADARYDLIHLDTIGLAGYLPAIREHSPTTCVSLGHHNIESHMLHRRASLHESGLLRSYFEREARLLESHEKRLCPRFDLNITCSDLDTARLRDLTDADPVVTIPNGVDTTMLAPGTMKRDPNRLLFVGTMNWYPNVDAMRFFLNEAWPLLTAAHPALQIDIIGNAPPQDLLRAAQRDPRVRVHGFVDDLQPYLQNAGIYVCPIRDGGGTKLKVLEAFASGIPMVAHPVACEGIEIQDGVHAVLASSAADFAAAVSRLMERTEERARLADSARRLVEERYSFSSIGQMLHQSFRAVAETRQAGAR